MVPPFPKSKRAPSSGASEAARILRSDAPRESDPEVVARLLRMFSEAAQNTHWKKWREIACKCFRYRESDQWEPAEIAELERRGQPASVINEIKPVIDRGHGQFIQSFQTTTYVGRNTPADDQTAAVLADLGRYVDQDNLYEFEESGLVQDALTSGASWLEMDVEENDLGQKRIFERKEDPLIMFPDPYFKRLDLSDARYVARAKWIDEEQLIAIVPDKEQQIRACARGHAYTLVGIDGVDQRVSSDPALTFVDPERHLVRVAEVWYRRKVRMYRIFTEQGAQTLTEPINGRGLRELREAFPGDAFIAEPTIVDQIWKGMFCAGLLLHHGKWPRKSFPFIPFFADRKKNGVPYGWAEPLLPIQDGINKRESKAINMLSNRRIIAEENALKNEEEAQIENARADGIIVTAQGAVSGGRVVFQDNNDIGQGQLAMLQEAKAAIPRVSGINDESRGLRSEVRSGLGIARKQQMTSLMVSPTAVNLLQYRHHRARLQLVLIKEVFDEEMTFQVTDDPNAARTVQVTRGQLAAIKERTYDIVITDSPSYATMREQQLDMIFRLWPQVAQLGPGMMKVAIAMTDLREKDGLMKMLDQAMTPPPQLPKMSLALSWENLSDQEKAFIAMTAFQSPEFATYLAKRAGDPAWDKKLRAELAKTEIKEGTRASVEHGRLDFAAMQTAMEGLLKSRELSEKQTADAPPSGVQAAAGMDGQEDTSSEQGGPDGAP